LAAGRVLRKGQVKIWSLFGAGQTMSRSIAMAGSPHPRRSSRASSSSGLRGRHGRQVLNGQRKSATVIQAHVRGRHGRVVLHAQAESATMIQANVRGQHDRAAIRSRIEAEAFEAAAVPDELADLEAHRRTKYAQVEAKYSGRRNN
jgi:head-tail adaptor